MFVAMYQSINLLTDERFHQLRQVLDSEMNNLKKIATIGPEQLI